MSHTALLPRCLHCATMLPGNSKSSLHPDGASQHPSLDCSSGQKCQGTTLIELMIMLVIVAILADLGTRSWAASYQTHQSNRVARDLLAAIQLARTSSALQRQWATLCPSTDGMACTQDWGRGILVFLDVDRNGKLDPDDRTIYRYQPAREGSTLSWRSFRKKPYLQITQRGWTNQQNGSFIYCPPDQNPRYARVVIVNKLGRARQGVDRDGDGIAETASGKPVEC